MLQNAILEIFIIVLLLLIILSMIPIIELKYKSDLYDKMETFNKYCLNNDISLINELEVKNSYMWNMSTYIYDVDNLSNFFRGLSDTTEGDYLDLNRDISIIMVNNKYINNIMKIYNYYLNMSLGLFIFLMIFFASQIYIYIYFNSYSELINCLKGCGGEDCFRYYIYSLFIYILLFIIFFSILLKKLTELYADTDTYQYIMLMKELDILLKENKQDSKEITDIIKKYSKYKINDIAYTTIHNSVVVGELVAENKKQKNIKDTAKKANKKKTLEYKNNNDYNITLKNIEKIEYYNSDEAKNKIKNKVEDIFRFIYVYIVFLIVPLYILSISLQGNYVYILFAIIVAIIFSISVYNVYYTLQ